MDRWTTIRVCSHGQALVLSGRLEAEGIPSRLRADYTRTIDPLLVEPGVLDAEVQVLEGWVAAATRVLSSVPIASLGSEAVPERDGGELRALAALGRRIRWCTCMIVFAPYGLWLGVRYLQLVREARLRPEGHVWSLLGIAVCGATTLLVLGMILACGPP